MFFAQKLSNLVNQNGSGENIRFQKSIVPRFTKKTIVKKG